MVKKVNLPKRSKVFTVKHIGVKPLNDRQKVLNKSVSKFRFTVERTFGGITKCFDGNIARYVGMAKTETQHYLQSICYNLKRASRLII